MNKVSSKVKKTVSTTPKQVEAGLHYSYEQFLADLSVRIRQLRKERGLTLRDMVVRHGFHVSQWQAFERGKRGVALPSILRICEIFQIKIAELLGDAGEVKSVDLPSNEAKRRRK